jgi:hypothetical protein
LKIHRVDEGAQVQTKSIENLFGEIIAENFSNIGKDRDIQRQEAYRIPNRHDQKNPLHILLYSKC